MLFWCCKNGIKAISKRWGILNERHDNHNQQVPDNHIERHTRGAWVEGWGSVEGAAKEWWNTFNEGR